MVEKDTFVLTIVIPAGTVLTDEQANLCASAGAALLGLKPWEYQQALNEGREIRLTGTSFMMSGSLAGMDAVVELVERLPREWVTYDRQILADLIARLEQKAAHWRQYMERLADRELG
jgi:hypothetical protein